MRAAFIFFLEMSSFRQNHTAMSMEHLLLSLIAQFERFRVYKFTFTAANFQRRSCRSYTYITSKLLWLTALGKSIINNCYSMNFVLHFCNLLLQNYDCWYIKTTKWSPNVSDSFPNYKISLIERKLNVAGWNLNQLMS